MSIRKRGMLLAGAAVLALAGFTAPVYASQGGGQQDGNNGQQNHGDNGDHGNHGDNGNDGGGNHGDGGDGGHHGGGDGGNGGDGGSGSGGSGGSHGGGNTAVEVNEDQPSLPSPAIVGTCRLSEHYALVTYADGGSLVVRGFEVPDTGALFAAAPGAAFQIPVLVYCPPGVIKSVTPLRGLN